MKRSVSFFRSRRFSSFTLVELLVVIAIIAILASVLFSAGNSAILAAKRARAANLATQINTAVLNYYTEYSVYPIPSDAAASSDVSYASNDVTHWQNIAWALCGNVNAYTPGSTQTPTVSNARAIAFLSLNKSDIDGNGVPVNPIYSSLANNNYFNIAIDGDYNGILSNLPSSTAPTATTNVIAGGVAVWANCNTPNTTNANFWVHTY